MLQTHKEVFSPGIGKEKSHTATLTLKPDAKPKFCKARPVPYALVNKVGQELDNLEKQGILSKVQHSEWATPVVPVLKQSGDVRLCGDFKITLNPVLQAEQYTLPRVEDIFANLGSGQKFSKIDLRQAYLQLPLNEESRPLTVIICGRHFTLVTDHQPLKYIFSPSTGIPATSAARQQRYAAFLSGFNYTIEYKSSKENANADTFSRLPLSTEVKDDSEMETMYYTEVLEALPVSSANISKASRQDPVLSRAIDFTTTTWPATVSDEVKPYFHKRHELSVHQDCLLWGTRVLVPAKLRPQVLQALHDGHLGIVKMKNMARNYFWWPGLDKDIEHMAKGCSGCMHSQQNPQLSPLHPWIFPDSPWHRVHIDYAGPFMGHMFLIVIDAHSKWAEVVPTDSSTSSKTIDILLTIFARFGLPKQIVSDNAPNFTSDELKNFVRSNAIKHISSAPYHPATNGIAERFVQIFKNAMKSAKKDCGSLHTKLSKFLLAYRNSQNHTTRESSARLLLGRSTRTRLDCLRPSLLEKVTQSQSDQVRHHSQARARVFNTGDNVLTRDYRAADRWAHGTTKARNGPPPYSIQTSPGIVWRRHADQIVHT